MLEEYPSGDIKFYVYPEYLGHDSKEYIYVSLAHEACLSYLIFLVHRDSEALNNTIQACIRWRKQCKELGAPRTKLERVARVGIRRLPKIKGKESLRAASSRTGHKARAEGKGMFDPAHAGKGLAALETVRNKPKRLQEWIIIDPEGNRFKIVNLAKFCREHNLCHKRMGALAHGYRADRPGEYSCRLVRDAEL